MNNNILNNAQEDKPFVLKIGGSGEDNVHMILHQRHTYK